MNISNNNVTWKTVTTYIWREHLYYIKAFSSRCEIIQSHSQVFLSSVIPKQITLSFFLYFLFGMGCFGSGSKTAAAAAGRSGPSVRPPWVTDPNFADRFRPDKTSTVVTQHQQLVEPTPMQNRSSILQAAQQAPEDSGRTPLCGACNKIIRWERTVRRNYTSDTLKVCTQHNWHNLETYCYQHHQALCWLLLWNNVTFYTLTSYSGHYCKQTKELFSVQSV